MGFQDDGQTTRVDIALLLLRVAFGGLMLYGHGWGKFYQLLGDAPIRFEDPLGFGMLTTYGLAIFAEVLCAFLVVIGLFTRWAVLPIIFTMLVAIFFIHYHDPFYKMELALLYLAPFVALLLTGAGRYSLDGLRNSRIS